jgi:hypothetical protein
MGEAAPNLRIVESDAGEMVGDLPALLPPGDYQLRLDFWATSKLFGRSPKLALWFKVMDMGEHFEARVPRYYNVVDLKGRAGRWGRFKAAAGGALARDYARLLALPKRFDRFNLEQLTRHVVSGKVDTVTTGSRQEKLAPASQYSVVRELLRIEQ